MRRVPATVSGEIVLRDLGPRATERLRRTLSYPHPERLKAKRFGGEDPSVPMRFDCMTEHPDGSVSAPRGAVDLVRRTLAEDDFAAEFTDERRLGAPIDLPGRPSLRHYQDVGVRRLLQKTQGMIVLPCGSGKTLAGVGAVAAVGRTAVAIAHTEDLLDQWTEDIREHLGVEPGRVDGDRKDVLADVVVASVFSLAPMLEAHPDLGKRFGLVILDEAHHAPAVTTQRCLRLLPARYRLGLTATPEREDGHELLVAWSFGPTLLVKTVQELVSAGFLMMPRLRVVTTDFDFPVDPGDARRFTKLHNAVVANKERNALVAEIAAWDALAGESVLVLSNRKPHCRKLGKLIAEYGVEVRVVTSDTKKAERKDSIRGLRDGTVSVVVATSLADEGLNVKRLSKIVLAFPDRAFGRTVQRAGRLTRVWEGKDPVLYDLVDARVEALASRAAERRSAYRSIGMSEAAQGLLPGIAP